MNKDTKQKKGNNDFDDILSGNQNKKAKKKNDFFDELDIWSASLYHNLIKLIADLLVKKIISKSIESNRPLKLFYEIYLRVLKKIEKHIKSEFFIVH